MSRRLPWRALALMLLTLAGLSACAESEPRLATSTLPQPTAAAQRYTVTRAGQLPIDVFVSPSAEGYVILPTGQTPIYLISDKKGGYILQRPGVSASFVTPRQNGSWAIVQPGQPPSLLFRQDNGWILQTPGELPTLITPR